MNREITFRAWDSKFGVMLNNVAPYGNDNIIVVDVEFNSAYGDNADNRYDSGVEEAGPEHVCITGDLIIQQFTGLKDKNGKEIYEGDIVRWGLGFTGSYDTEHWHRYAKVELFPALQFKIIKYFNTDTQKFQKGDDHVFGFSNFIYTDTERYLEVIGNIHENPELLHA